MIAANIPSREKKILSILNARHGIVSGKELSTKIGVSERTIRSDISHINSELSALGIEVVASHGKGYSIRVGDRAVFHELFSEEQNYITKDDRISTLLLKLLSSDEWYDLGVLEDEMYVSNTTLEKDIKILKKMICQQHPYLKIERKLNCIRLEDDEKKKRDLFTRFYVKNWDYDSREGIVIRQKEFGQELLDKIQTIVKNTFIASETYLDDYAFIYLAISIAVMLFRVKSGHDLSRAAATREITGDGSVKEDSSIDADIKHILDDLAASEHITLSESEYIYLSLIKRQLVFLCLKTYSKNFVIANTNIVCHGIVNDLLTDILGEYGIDFTRDDKLFVDLTRHVQALVGGIVAPHLQNHVLGDELRRKNPFLGDIAHFMRKRLSERCQIALGIEEEDYLLPFIMLSEEERYKKVRGDGIPTAVISHYNESMTHYLMKALKRYYGGILDLKGPYAMYNKELIDRNNIRFVLTTVKMDAFRKYFNTPILTVSPILDERDQAGIDLYLTSLKIAYLYKEPSLQMDKYFLQKLIYKMPEKSNLSSALSFIEKRLIEETGITSLKTFSLEEDYFCNPGNGLLFCYQINSEIKQTVVSLVDLGKELSSRQIRNIKTVMYMLMPRTEKHTLGRFYYMAMAFAQYPQELKSLFEGTSIEDMSFNISRGLDDTNKL